MSEEDLIFRTPPIIRQRRIAAVTIMVAAVLLYVVFLCVTGGRINRITRQQENRLEYGMSKAEVIRILGEPHGTDGKDNTDSWYYWSWETTDPLHVGFDKEGRLEWLSN